MSAAKLYILPVTARISAASEQDALKTAQAIYDAGGAILHTAQANGADAEYVLLNFQSAEIEHVGGGYSEDALNEARSALKEGADIQNVNRVLIEQCALLIESAREMVAQGSESSTAAYEVTQWLELSYYETLQLATDTPELFHFKGERGDSIMAMLENTIKDALQKADAYRLTGDEQKEAE